MKFNNTFLFFGADNNVGVTTITQSVGEILAALTNKRVLILTLNHKPSDEFVKESNKTLDNLRSKLTSRIITPDDVFNETLAIGKAQVLLGPKNIVEVRNYEHKDIQHLIQLVSSNSENIVLIDAGSDLDNPLTVTSLITISKRFLVTTQNKHSVSEFKRKLKFVLSKLNVHSSDFKLIVNKSNQDFHIETSMINEEYNTETLSTIPFAEEWWESETEGKLLHHYNDDFNKKLLNVVKYIAAENGIQIETEETSKEGIFTKFLFGSKRRVENGI